MAMVLAALLLNACGAGLVAPAPDLPSALPAITIAPAYTPQPTRAPAGEGLPNRALLMFATVALAGVAVLVALLVMIRPWIRLPGSGRRRK